MGWPPAQLPGSLQLAHSWWRWGHIELSAGEALNPARLWGMNWWGSCSALRRLSRVAPPSVSNPSYLTERDASSVPLDVCIFLILAGWVPGFEAHGEVTIMFILHPNFFLFLCFHLWTRTHLAFHSPWTQILSRVWFLPWPSFPLVVESQVDSAGFITLASRERDKIQNLEKGTRFWSPLNNVSRCLFVSWPVNWLLH